MGEDEDDGRASLPLLGVILCCTSIPTEQRSELAAWAEQMGAVHKLDLTSDVTHLIVGDPTTPKYKYVARERPDIVVVTREWIEAVRALWMQGEDIDLPALEDQHRRLALTDSSICLTGFDDPAQRQELRTLVAQHGAEYHGHLTMNVTHLVANRPEGEKYKHAKQWGLKVVSVEWLVDSIERGMILDENVYDPSLAPEERGKNAWTRKPTPAMSLGKRGRQDGGNPADTEAILAGRRKLRRTASTKLQSQNSAIWTDIIGGGFDRKSTAADPASEDRQEANSPTTIAPQPLRDGINRRASADTSRKEPATTTESGLFARRNFYLHGFDAKKTRVLEDYILAENGQIMSFDLDDHHSTKPAAGRTSYLIVPHNFPASQRRDLSVRASGKVLASEWWIERCLHLRTLTDPSREVYSCPFRHIPIRDFEKLTVCSTGFSGVDLLHIYKTVRLMGAKYDEFLRPSASVLVCSDTAQRSDKLSHAAEWKIPCVSAQWLWDSAEKGERLPFSLYTKNAKQPTEPATMADPSSSHLPREHLVEGISTQVQAASVVGLAEKMPQDGSSRTHVSSRTKPSSTTDETAKGPTESDVTTNVPRDAGSVSKVGHTGTSTSTKEDLNAAIASLLARKQATPVPQTGAGVVIANSTTTTTTTTSATITAAAAAAAAAVTGTVISVAEVERDGRKPPPRLGRACVSDLSSSTSTAAAAAAAAAAAGAAATAPDDDKSGASDVDPLMLGHPADPGHDPGRKGNQPSSQYVRYEDPEVQAQRERVLRKMGATAAELVRHAPPPRAKSTAMARDAGGVGTRTRQKTANVGA